MAIRDDIAEIKAAFETAEEDQRKARRSLRRLHNLCGEKLSVHAELLGLTEADVTVFGGGTPKPPVEDEE